MTVRAKKFTPEVLLSAPRRSAAIPSADGTLALFFVSTYDFEKHARSSEIRVLDMKTGQSNVLTADLNASEPTWLGEKHLVLWPKGGEKCTTSLVMGDAGNFQNEPEVVASFNGSVSNLKTTVIDSDTIALVVSGLATPEGELFNPETAPKSYSTAKVYTQLFVRHWDSYVTNNKSTIWYTTLKKSQGIYKMNVALLRNAIPPSLKLEAPVPPFGGSDAFDVSKSGIVFTAKDPKLDPASYTKTDIYYIALNSFEESEPPTPILVKTKNLEGYSETPVFSPDAKSVAFTKMKSIQYESDKTRLMLIPDITDLTNVQEFYETEDGEGLWDIRPEGISWSNDSQELYLFKLPASPRRAGDLPKAIISDGNVTNVHVLPDNTLLVSSNSLVDNSIFSILDPLKPSDQTTISSSSEGGTAFGLSQDQVDEFWYAGAEEYNVHAWVLKPSNFDKSKKYPLVYLIHGGPRGAWSDSFSTRWNPLVFAEQGYVVVTINPTGSTGYGMAFQNAVQNNWGGRPYIDLVKGFKYIEHNIPYIDSTRAVALGNSYGGYMINWIQGHDLGRKFKVLVTHNGMFSTLNFYSTEELFCPNYEFGGTIWENREGYEKWDPAAHIKEWATPHLIIHSELDYRLSIGEGLAPFNVLQMKGIESRLLTFSDENHWVLKPENSLVWHKEVFRWINKYSGIEAEQEELSRGVSGLNM
ncbi:dipeptidyl-peptidase-like protein V precursor [Stipitochalara longipes BDJ]|nr:dipeptidyl-peptidase-like protein V precursor [Stipitochalara longipes BDJ]